MCPFYSAPKFQLIFFLEPRQRNGLFNRYSLIHTSQCQYDWFQCVNCIQNCRHRSITVRQQMLADVHSRFCTNFRLLYVTALFNIRFETLIKPINDWIPFGDLHFIQIFDVLQRKLFYFNWSITYREIFFFNEFEFKHQMAHFRMIENRIGWQIV